MVIGSLYMVRHHVKMARWCNKEALAYLRRESGLARHNAATAADYRELRDEYMERARQVARIDG
jgi:hypothetical protein